MILTLAEAQAQVSVTHSHDDGLLEDAIAAAHDHIEKYIGRPVPWTNADGEPQPVPASIKQAAKLLVGDFYNNREALIIGTIVADNPAVERLLHFHRIGLGV